MTTELTSSVTWLPRSSCGLCEFKELCRNSRDEELELETEQPP